MCLNVISAGTALDEATGESWQEEFRKQVGRIDLPLAHPAVGAAKPWLTVVDDLPTSQAPASISASERNGKHGHTLANMARDLLCKDDTANDATCVASVRSRLALAHKCFDSAMNLGKDCQVKTTRDGKAIDSSANRKGGFSDTGILQDRDWLRDLVLRTMNKGGHVGFPGDVAEAINDEVDAWRSLNVNTRPSLILNLSLGWLPSSGGTQLNLDDMPIEMQAVYRALEKASCYGAIVVAAGGNRLFGPGEFDGPWLPAAWEKRRAPSHWECSTMYNEDPLLEEEEIVIPCPPEPSSSSLLPASRAPNSPPPPYPPPSNLPTPYRPLIYSVGGLNALGKPLAIGNELAMPRLAAYGDHAVAMGRADGKLLSPMTGTSVSALVVSSAAAAARYYQPKLYSHNIMQVLWDSGAGQENDMGLLADYCQSASKDPRLGDCGAVHRVTIGAAARKACEQWSSGCLVSSSSFPPLPKWERELPDLEQLSSLSADVDITCTPAPNYDVEIPDLWSKWGPKYRLAGTHEKRRSPPKDVEITCTSDDYYGIDAPDIRLQPWVHPQPGDPYCIFCVLDISANNAYLSLSNPYDSKIDNVSLIVGSQTLSLHGVEVEPSKTTPVLSVKIDNLKSDTPVFITANVNGMSTTNPIAIVK
ncbi:MAG: hypothetical protein MUC50_17785 [Myxococcota bacterium]|nr:hypothetical protein [Myxococcota bacterium]